MKTYTSNFVFYCFSPLAMLGDPAYMNISKSSLFLKASSPKLYLPRKKETINKELIFIQIVLLTFSILIPAWLLSVKAPQKIIFWYIVKLFFQIPFMSSISSDHTPEINFQFKKQEKVPWKVFHLHNPVFAKNVFQKVFPCYGLNSTTAVLLQGYLWH